MSRLRRIIDWLPRDMSLPEEEFRSRHNAMTGMLLLHVPVLFAYGLFTRGFAPTPLAIELAFPLVASLLGALPMIRRSIRTFAITTGLIYSSVVLLHLSGGAAESALHFLIVLAFVFLYRDWFLFLWATVLMGSSYKLLELTEGALGEMMVATGTPEMALWALMAAASVASIGLILAWKSAEESQRATIAALETARERDEAAARRDAYGRMYVNLARRGQSLVDRQLSVIDRLEEDVDDPDLLAELFELDHLTTRIRRHGESLLVVADVDLPAHRDAPVPLADVVRGAQSEIEQYRRVDARVDESIAVDGAITRDLVHLVAELLDNATTYSPPDTTVTVAARAGDGGSVVLTIEDRGIGLSAERLEQANRDLQDTDVLDEDSIRHLGFRVVARLSGKHDVNVRLTSTNGGGVTAWVQLPATVVVTLDPTSLIPARMPATADAEPDDAVTVLDLDATAAAGDAPPPGPSPTAADPVAPPPAEPVAERPDMPPPTVPEEPSAAMAEAPAPPADATPTATPVPPPPPQVSAGFSANGRRGRLRRALSSGSGRSSNGSTAMPPPPEAPTPPTQDADAVEDLAPPVVPAAAEQSDAPPPLPRRRRGAAASSSAEEEALDLFGELDSDGDRASLGDFQRGQESARQEARG